MKIFVAIVLFGFILTLSSAFVFNDPCTAHVFQQGLQTATVLKKVANDACLNGSIWWSYPKGSFQMTFSPKGHTKFSVCIRSDMGPLLEAVYEVTEAGKRPLANPSEQNEVCAEAIQGKVIVEFIAPEMLAYMTLYHYRLVFTS